MLNEEKRQLLSPLLTARPEMPQSPTCSSQNSWKPHMACRAPSWQASWRLRESDKHAYPCLFSPHTDFLGSKKWVTAPDKRMSDEQWRSLTGPQVFQQYDCECMHVPISMAAEQSNPNWQCKTAPIVFVILSLGSGGDWTPWGISHLGSCGYSLMVAMARVI